MKPEILSLIFRVLRLILEELEKVFGVRPSSGSGKKARAKSVVAPKMSDQD